MNTTDALPAVSPLVTSRVAAGYLNVSESTLSRWRNEHKGPPFLQMDGIIRYRRDALDAWLREIEHAHEQ
ncbi:helix-turn-helix domain-containing protein [Brevibacterium casei]|uniref:Helix-turn-helix domain-containing protein n=1 Tax=Brevibacterium ammoniilyticum TaxID=1046555 RepID=A0ABP9U5H7_9MICO|nr:helix-turn-helix domain-containing protein [Brevibacterium casei]QQT68736.1 helix-turn-helix domain-containing protein [Brevibacterium casei]